MVAGKPAKVTGFRKCFEIYKLTRLADRFIVGERERNSKITSGFLDLTAKSGGTDWRGKALGGESRCLIDTLWG